MESPSNLLFKKFERVSKEVKSQLKKQGFAVPTKNTDGSVNFGKFKIVKNHRGYFDIVDDDDSRIVENINLAKSAIVLANTLAVHHMVDKKVIEQDSGYGSASLEEQLYKKSSKQARNIDKWDLMTTKGMIASARKQFYKISIDESFEKLVNLNK